MKPFRIKANLIGYSGSILTSWSDSFPLLIDCPIQQETSIIVEAYACIMKARISASPHGIDVRAITVTCVS